MPTSPCLSYILEWEDYKCLPQNVKNDIENERCPTDVVSELLRLWWDANLHWGRKKAQDWVRRVYKKTKKVSGTEEKLEQIKKYLEARCYEEIKKEWADYCLGYEIVRGEIYILAADTWPGVLKVGMVHKRVSEERLPEIRRKTGESWNIIYMRETLDPRGAESEAHARLPNRLNPKEELFQVSPSEAKSIVDKSIDKVEESINWLFDKYIAYKFYGQEV